MSTLPSICAGFITAVHDGVRRRISLAPAVRIQENIYLHGFAIPSGLRYSPDFEWERRRANVQR
jgi:hypothetical protein